MAIDMVRMCKKCIAECVQDEILNVGDEVCVPEECECRGLNKKATYNGDLWE